MAKILPLNGNEIPPIENVNISSSVSLSMTETNLQNDGGKCLIQLRSGEKEHKAKSKRSSHISKTEHLTNDEDNLNTREYEKNSRVALPTLSLTVSDKAISEQQININEVLNSNDWSFCSETRRNEENASKRNQSFKSIILGGYDDFSWLNMISVTFGIILFGFMQTISLTLIPYHDLLQSPEYWYELLLPATFWGALEAVNRCTQLGTFMNMEILLRPRNMALMALAGCVCMLLLVSSTHFIWTSIFLFRYPIPLLGFMFGIFSNIYNYAFCWFLIPKEIRKISRIQKGLFYIILQLAFQNLVGLAYQRVIQSITDSSDQYQPIVALALPIVRELNIWISEKLLKKAANGDEGGAMIFMKFMTNAFYAVILCTVLGSIATNETSWVLIGIDYACNMWLCFNLVWTHKRNPTAIQIKIDRLLDLVICELVEFLTPLAYVLVLTTAYHGPNKKLFGNIGNSYWTFQAIEDINQNLQIMMILFLADFSSTVASAVILLCLCNIRLWKAFNKILNEFAKVFCVYLGSMLYGVNIYNDDINLLFIYNLKSHSENNQRKT